ncbi:MAG: methyltransferase domain-containing protein [Microvirga sp.]
MPESTPVDGSSFNWSLKDDIREYWSLRSATFDLSPGHEIFTDDEREAWQELLRRHLGDGGGRSALDLASGTGVVSLLLNDLGFQVTGLDFSDEMLARARAKAAGRGAPIRFIAGDAEVTLEENDAYDVIATRHLVWTLVHPDDAFREWFRLIKPGGRLLVVDADMGAPRSRRARFLRSLARVIGRVSPGPARPGVDRATHDRILSQVYFSEGARADAVAALAQRAGFRDIVIDRDLARIHRAQWKLMPLKQRLERASQDRYAICARKP